MNREDLRVGNYVNAVFHTPERTLFLRQIRCIHLNVAELEYEKEDDPRTTTQYSQLEGIRLNNTWLVRFGFVNNGYGGFEKSWKPNAFMPDLKTVYRVGQSMISGFSIYEGSFEIKNSIEYVHELQNLWYHLTRNDELTL